MNIKTFPPALLTGLIIGIAVLTVNSAPKLSLVYADELDKLQEEKQAKLEEKADLQGDVKEAEVEKESFDTQLDYYKGELVTTQSTLTDTKSQIAKIDREKLTKEEQYTAKLLEKNSLMRDLYKRTEVTPLELMLGSDDLNSFAKAWQYYRRLVTEGRRQIMETAFILDQIKSDLEKEQAQKANLEVEATVLASQTVYFDNQVQKVSDQISGLHENINVLEEEIARITAKQQQIIAAKQSSLNLPQSMGTGALNCTDDRKISPGFSPAYAFYTFGIPHRVGMSQYGALGRAQDGQDAEEILKAYFDDVELVKDYDTEIMIKVDGHGEYAIEDYVKRIYEMPASWPMEALKAQAIAARSYALSYTDDGKGSICTTQACQVFKPEEKGGQWNEAVEATAGWVLTSGGSPIKAWYSSTAGGYTFRNEDVWGGSHRPWTKRLQDGSGSYGSFSDVLENAYDSESPCMYTAQGWRSEYGKSAWLKGEEVADIANVIMLARFTDVDKNHLYQVDKGNPEGTDTWSIEKVREELRARGGEPFSGISSIEVSGVNWEAGRATNVRINGEDFDGIEFKDWFNLRAPANIQIVGPLFNVERR